MKNEYICYRFKIGEIVVEPGVTKDINEVEKGFKKQYPKGHIVKIGLKVSIETALEWLRKEPK